MDKAAALKLVAASSLPEGVKEYLAAPASGGSQLRKALKADPAGTINGLERLLGEAAGILGLGADTVLFVTGFDGNNLAGDRLDAALAELGAALFLRGEGFMELRLVERAAGRTADISGFRNGERYAFEVCRVRGGAFACVPAQAKQLSVKYAAKKAQLAAYCKKTGCRAGGVILVTGMPAFESFTADPRLEELAEAVRVGLSGSLPPVCLLCGGSCAVFPPWPGSRRT
jgi:hypothetical protein